MKFLTVIIILVQVLFVPLSVSREVTHEDIRDAMLSLVHMFRSSEDKLERHEFREKALGEQLKKALAGLDKRHRALEPLRGAISRLDERLSNVETVLMQKDEQEKIQAQKIADSINAIQGSLQTLSGSILNMMRTELGALSAATSSNDVITNDTNSRIAAVEDVITKKIDSLNSNVDGLQTNISNLKENITKEILKSACKQPEIDSNQFSKHMAETEKLLTRYETKLSEYDSNMTRIQTEIVPLGEVSLADEAWHSKMTAVLENQEMKLQAIQKSLQTTEEIMKDLPGKSTLANVVNKTIQMMQEVRYEITSNTDKGVIKLSDHLSELGKSMSSNYEDLSKIVTESSSMAEQIYGEIGKNYETIHKEVQTLSKIDKVMVQTSEIVLDTKRRVEYGVLQIVVELGEVVKTQSKELNNTLNQRFDDIELSIVDNQTGALANLSSKIEQEMSQVWRQIGIMYQQLTASNTALDRLQQQTEQYVNGSVTTMDSMEGKVGMITTRMSEVDENLNYLLGRLSLVTQEFNQIKLGLGDALDNIKSSFLTVQSKIKEAGPGPYNISEESFSKT